MTVEQRPKFVHVVSHGPRCLDGVTAAVVVARYAQDATVLPTFSSYEKIDDTLLGLRCEPQDAGHEIWITDISWTAPAVDRHLQHLIDRGVHVYWIDHHRTALERYRGGGITARLTDCCLSEEHAASRLTFEYLSHRGRQPSDGSLARLERLVAMADDNDRWLHQIPGSRELALTVSAMHGIDAYRELLTIDPDVTYTPLMMEAARRVEAELRRSLEVAEQSRVVSRLPDRDVRLITAVCDGYPSEIADAWRKTFANAVFALFDAQSLAVSLRRSPDCEIDLSHVARHLGGGGHAAAAGCEIAALRRRIAEILATTVAPAVEREAERRRPT